MSLRTGTLATSSFTSDVKRKSRPTIRRCKKLAVLSLHLVQNALIMVNTLMLERVLKEDGFLQRMGPEDYRALTPLFTSHVNPYGDFFLDLDKPSFLEVA